MRVALIGLVALLSSISLGCHHNVAHSGCGHSVNSCSSCNSCGSCGGLFGQGGAIGRRGRLHRDGTGLAIGDGSHHGRFAGLQGGVHGDGRGLGLGNGGPQYIPPIPRGGIDQELMGPPGPPTGAYAYPYYTLRAPRDFLLNNPPSIGP